MLGGMGTAAVLAGLTIRVHGALVALCAPLDVVRHRSTSAHIQRHSDVVLPLPEGAQNGNAVTA